MGEPNQLNTKVMMSSFLKLRFPFENDNIFTKIAPQQFLKKFRDCQISSAYTQKLNILLSLIILFQWQNNIFQHHLKLDISA
jgi:hypothetical protein